MKNDSSVEILEVPQNWLDQDLKHIIFYQMNIQTNIFGFIQRNISK